MSPRGTTDERIGLCPGCEPQDCVETIAPSDDGFEAIIRPSSRRHFRSSEWSLRGEQAMESNEETARRLLHEISESLDIDPGKLARVGGQFITPEGNQVYRVRLRGKISYVTIPEE
jgi:hypothetical protein